MSSLQAESDFNNELNDSGFAQDEPTMKKQSLNNVMKPQLLDLSDDVLLYILKYCNPRDLKSLGFTCSRLAALVLDRTLWERVDARSEPVGPDRLSWYMKHGLSPGTTELLLSGYAREAKGCLGHMNCEYKKVEKDAKSESDPGHWVNGGFSYDPSTRRGIIRGGPVIQIYETMPSFLDAVYGPPGPDDATCVAVLVSAAGGNAVHIRATCFPLTDTFGPDIGPEWAPPDSSCPGPQYTLTQGLLRDLVALCPAITSLALEYCNIDCTTRNIGHFPRTLKKLSLRGSKCYNQPMDKSFLFKIQDYLTQLEELNLSECDWIEPSSLLPVSKLPALRRLYMRRCSKLTECVAYSSLATRYGFKSLQVIDLRESPVGDSEVSSFGWVSTLEELYVSPAPHVPQPVPHAHYIGDVLPQHIELDPWEEQEPEYFKSKQQKTIHPDLDTRVDEDNDTQSLKRKMDTPVVCSCGARNKDEIVAKRPKADDVNEGASTSKWSPSEQPPPLRYFRGKSSEPTVSMELEMETDEMIESSWNTKPYAMETSEIVESAEIDSPGTVQSFVMESFRDVKPTEADSPGASQSFGMESSGTTKSPKPDSSGISPSSGMESSRITKSPKPDSPGSSQSFGMESSRIKKSPKPDSPGTSQSFGMESSRITKAPKSASPSTSQSSEMESGTTKSPKPDSPGSSQSSGMETSGTTKPPDSPSPSTSSGMETSGTTKLSDSPSPSTSQSSGMETSGTTKSPKPDSPGISQSPRMESSGTIKAPESPSPSTSQSSEMESGTTKSPKPDLPGSSQSFGMESSRITKAPKSASPNTSQSPRMESSGTIKAPDSPSPSTSPLFGMKSSGTTKSPKPDSPGTSQSFGMESSRITKAPKSASPNTSQSSGMETSGSTKPPDSPSPSNSQSSGMESGTTKPPDSPSPSTSSGMETSGTTKPPNSPSRSTSQSSGMETSETTKLPDPDSPSTSYSIRTDSPGSTSSEAELPGTSQSPGLRFSRTTSPGSPRSSRNTDSPRPGPSNQPETGRLSFQRYIRFRQNQNPVVVDRPDDANRHQEPVHKILYVNVGRRLNTMYRLTMPVYAFGDHEMGGNARRLDGPFAPPRFDPSTLVSDTTVHRFGRADSDNISYINIGPNGIHQEPAATRPDRSNLRVLSMTGFRNITNRSLVHLATAAPMLRMIDFTGTRVTERGVANFRSLRPDCKVLCDKDM